MVINKDSNMIELYWDDLSEKTQNELLNLWGDNGNYNLLPIIELPIDAQ